MAGAYCTWQDAYDHLDKKSFPETPVGELTSEVTEAAKTLERRLRRFFAFPFDEADHPEAFDLAGEIVSRWAAAAYMRKVRQTEGRSDDLWYAQKLDDEAEGYVAQMKERQQPSDTPEADDPVVTNLYDGRTAGDRDDSVFRMAQITPGSTTHW